MDDLLITGSDYSAIRTIVSKLSGMFKIREETSVDKFLGFVIDEAQNGVNLYHEGMIMRF